MVAVMVAVMVVQQAAVVLHAVALFTAVAAVAVDHCQGRTGRLAGARCT